MSYLQEYLKVIPQVEADKIESFLKKNEEIFTILDIPEKEFKELIDKLNEDYKKITVPVELSQKIKAEDLNNFFKNVAIDMVRLFTTQNGIEAAAENYNRIYEGNLEDMRKEVKTLQEKILDLDMSSNAEEGLKIHSFNFDPAHIYSNVEKDLDSYGYMFQDRDGTILEPVDIKRTYHKYHASLNVKEAVDLLADSFGNTNANIEVLYESPFTLDLENKNYDIKDTINNENNNFWMSIALKPNNNTDTIDINP